MEMEQEVIKNLTDIDMVVIQLKKNNNLNEYIVKYKNYKKLIEHSIDVELIRVAGVDVKNVKSTALAPVVQKSTGVIDTNKDKDTFKPYTYQDSRSSSGTSNHNTTYYNNSSTSYSSATLKLAFAIDHIEFYGVSKSNLDLVNLDENDLLINCTGFAHTVTPFMKEHPSWLDLLSKLIGNSSINQLVLDWKDMQAPPSNISRKFWETILAEAKKKGIKRIIVCCTGGHGRTGTSLVALSLVSGFHTDVEEAIKYIRANYYVKAVETAGQENYLKRIFGKV